MVYFNINHSFKSLQHRISFIGTPYWSQGAKKQFYVSKRCATRKECERIKHSNMGDCTYIWYEDWKCSDCCQGDKCNYYVIVSHGLHTDSKSFISDTDYIHGICFFSFSLQQRKYIFPG